MYHQLSRFKTKFRVLDCLLKRQCDTGNFLQLNKTPLGMWMCATHLFFTTQQSAKFLYFKDREIFERSKMLFLCQFHQYFTISFFIQKSFEQFFCTYILGLYFFGARKLTQKLLVKCWQNAYFFTSIFTLN